MGAPEHPDVAPGPDGTPRCSWCLAAPEYIEYHDHEWGRPHRDERGLFELLTLEAFQSGLSWLTILRKREGFRAAFAAWDIERIAAYEEADVQRLLADRGIVRHRGKIEATVANAGVVAGLHAEGRTLTEVLWEFAPEPGPAPSSLAELQPVTAESAAMAKELRGLGFRFVGPTTAYSLMQAAGLVNDHLARCAFRDAS